MEVSKFGLIWVFVLTSIIVSVQAQRKKAGPPLNVQETGHTRTDVSLSWVAPKKLPVGGHVISGYKILYKQDGQSDSAGKKIDVPPDTSYTVTDLAPGTTYLFKIATITSNGKVGGFSSWKRVRTEDAPAAPVPDPPGNVRGSAQGTDIAIEWTPPRTPIDGYVVSYGKNSVDENSMEVGQEERGATISGLDAGAEYQVAVQSVSGGQRSSPETFRATTGVPVPSAPGNLRLRSTSDSIDAEWAHTSAERDGVTGFEVSVGPDSNPTEQTVSMGSSDRFTTVSGLQPDQVYVVSVTAQNEFGSSSPVTDKISTQPGGGGGGGAANSPPNGMQIREGSDRATVTWDAATNDVDGYVVSMGTESNPNEFTRRVPSNERRRFKQDGLTPDTDYDVSIKSFDSEGESEPIQQGFRTRARPTPSRRPRPPAGTRVNRRYDSMGVSWQAPEGEEPEGYRLEVGTASNPRQFSRDYPAGTTSADVPGLTPDTNYRINLKSTSTNNGDSEAVRRRARTRRARRPKRPQRTRASSSRPDSIDVSWEDPSDADSTPENRVTGYRVDVGTPSNPRSKFSRRVPRGTNSVNVPGLDPDSEYQVNVVSTTSSGESEPVKKSVKTQNDGVQRPSRPNGMRVREGIQQATVNWEPADDDVDGYIVNMGTEDNPNQFTQRVPSRNRRRFRQTGLEPDTDYQVSVKSFDSSGESEPIQQGFRTRPRRPQPTRAPTGVRARPRYDSMGVEWEEPEDPNVDAYRLEVGTPSDPRQFSRVYPRGTRSANVPDLDPNTQYQINLVSTSEAGGDSDPVRRRARTRRTRRPKRPQRTRASSSRPDSIDVSWEDPDDDSITSYRVDVGTPSNPRSKFSRRIPRGTNSVNVPGLDPDSDYQVSVSSIAPSGQSEPVRKSASTQRRGAAGLSPPNGMQVNEESTSARVRWGASGSDNIDGYVVNIGTERDPTQFTQNIPKTTRSLKQKGLRPGTDYKVSVKAVNAGGESEPIEQGFRTKPKRSRGPKSPANVRANTRYDSVAVRWERPDDDSVTGYRLEYGTPSEPNQGSWDFPLDTTDFTIPDLDPDTDYDINLSSVSPSGNSEPVRRRGRTRRNRRPRRPARAKVNPGSNSLDLRWDDAKGDGVDGYRVDVGTPENPQQFSQRYPRDTTSTTVPGLDPDTDYDVQIVTTARGRESEPLRKPARTRPGAPSTGGGARESPPNGMQIREGPDRATVTWDPATNDVDGYVVSMGTRDNPNQFTRRVPSNERRRFKQDGLTPDTDYDVTVKSFDSEGESEPIRQGFRTRSRESRNPQPPTGTKVNRRYDGMGVTWEPPEGDPNVGYRLEVGTPSNPRQFTRDYPRGTTSADVPGLTPDTDYEINLVATSPDGDSEPVKRRARTRPNRRPKRPQRTRAASSSPDSADVSWEEPDDNSVDGYRVDVGTPSDPRRDFSRRYPRGTTRASIPNLRPDSQYQVSVVSTSPNGESEPVKKPVKTQNDGTRRPSRPNGMRIREAPESATVNWEPADGDVDGYIVNMGTEDNPNQFTQRVPSRDRRRFKQDGLEPDTDYQVSIKSFDSTGESEPIKQGFRTRPRRPRPTKAPTGVRAKPRYDSMGVEWEEPEDDEVTGYRLEVGTDDDPQKFTRDYPRGTTAANVPDLDPDTDYKIKLVSKAPSGDSDPVRRKARTRRTRRPKRPQRTRARSSRPDSLDVSWEDPDDDDITEYRVDVGTPSNPRSKFSRRIPRGRTPGETNSVNVPGLDPDTEYQVSVSSISPSGQSEPVKKSGKTQRRRPRGLSPPNGLQVNEESSTARVKWGPSGSDDIDGYVVNIGTERDPTQFTQNVPKTTTSLRQKGLRPGTDYKVSVKAINAGGESDPIEQGFRTRPKRRSGPETPANTKANTRYDSIKVKWDEPEDPSVDGYRLEYGTPSQPNQGSWRFPRGTTDFTIPDLDPDTDYEVNLYSTSPSGDSEPIRRRGRTRRTRRPKRPSRAKVAPSPNSMDVTWEKAKGDDIDGYRVDVGTPDNPRQFTQRVPRGTTQASFPGLDPDTDYQVNIVATAAGEESEPITKAARTSPAGSRPGGGARNSPPNGMQIREGTERATVTWDPATNDVDGYVVNMGTERNPNEFTRRVPSNERRRFKQDGLTPDTDYQVSIKSFDSEGESEPIQQGFRTRSRDSRNPQPPTGTKVNRRYDGMGVTWEPPEGDDNVGYRLEVGTPSNPRQFTQDYPSGTTSADVPNLTPDTDYEIKLVATSGPDESEAVRRKARTRPTRRPKRPQRTRARSSSPDSIDVSWEEPDDDTNDGYRVDVGTPSDPRRDFSRQYPRGTTRASIPNLRPDSQYQVSVVSTSPNGESEPAKKPVKTQDDGTRRPSRPNGMTVREATESATVNWEPADGDVDGYIVNMGTEDNPNQFTQRVPSRDRRRFRQDGLEPDTDYQVSIKSFDSTGESEPMKQGFRTRPRRPRPTKAPTGVRAKPRYDSMGVEWEEPEDDEVTGYRLEIGTDDDPQMFTRDYPRGTTAANVPDLDPDTDYKIKLTSKSPSGDSDPVRRKARTRRTRRPKRPQRTRARSSRPDSLDVSWEDPDDDDITEYRVDVGTPSNPRSKFSRRIPRGQTPGETNSVNVPGLDPDTDYQVSVSSISPSGQSEPVKKSGKTQRRRPQGLSPPNGLQVNEEPSSARVKWGPSGSDDIDGYVVNIGTERDPTQFTQNVPKTTTSLRQKGLRPGTDYKVSVKAINAGGESEPMEQGFRTRPKRTRGPKSPDNTKANTRYDSIKVKWDEPEDPSVDGYRLEYGTPSQPNQGSWRFPRGTTDFTIPDLDPDTDYEVNLYSTSPSGDSEPIRRRGRTRRNRRPKRPSRAKVAPSSNSMDVTWEKPKEDNIDGYRVDVGTPDNPRQFSQRFPRGTTRASIPGLDPDTDYQVNIVATSEGEESEPITKAARTRPAGSRPAQGARNSPPNGMQIREGTERATVTWDPATNDVNGYVVNMGTERNPNEFTRRVPSNERRRFKQDGLTPDTDYQVSIKSFDSEGESQPIQQGFRTRSRESSNPQPPTGTKVNRRYDGMGVTWDPPEDDVNVGYRLEVGTPSNPRQFTQDYPSGTTSADVPNLTPDTDYQINLKATLGPEESEAVRRKARTRPTRRPKKPQRTRASSRSPDSADVSWEEPDDNSIDGYRVDVGTPSDPRRDFSRQYPRGTTRASIPNLRPDSQYQVSVVSTSPDGESEPAKKPVKTQDNGTRRLSRPNGMRIREATESATVNWEPADGDVDGYIVNMGTEDNPNQFTQRVPSRDIRRFRQDGLEPDTDYQVSIKSFDSTGESEPIRQGFRTKPRQSRPTKAPTGVRAKPRYDSMGVEWEEPEDDEVTGYRLEVGTDDDPQMFTRDYPRGTTAANVPDLDPETDYKIKLISKSPSGDSDPVRRKARTRKTRRPKRPQRTRARSSSPNSLDVTWDDPDDDDITEYRVDVGTPSNPKSKFSRRIPRGTNSVNIPGLDPDTDYQVNIVSVSPSGQSEPVKKSGKTQRRRPRGTAPPNGLRLNEESDAVDINWGASASDNIEGYIVNVGTPDNPNQFSQRVPTMTNFRQTGLRPERDYQVSVQAYGPDGESEPIRQGFRTRPTRSRNPKPPKNIKKDPRYDSIPISWEEPEDPSVDGYRLEYGTPSEPNQGSWRFPRGTTDFTIPDLDPDTDYEVNLYSTSPSGDSEPIRRRGRTRKNRRPKRPSRLRARPNSDSIDVNWEKAKGEIQGYRLDVGTPSNPKQFSRRFPPDTTSFTVPGLDPDTDYEVNLVANSAEEESEPVTKKTRTTGGDQPEGAPDTPTGVNVSPEGNALRVRWNPQRGVNGYVIKAGRASRGYPPNEITEQVNSRKDNALLRNLQPNTDYLVSVSAVNDAGESRPARSSGRTEQALPGRPEGLAAMTTPTTATLNWREPGTPVDGYRLSLGTVTYPNMYTKELRPGTTSHTFEDLDPDTIYNAELTSYNSVGSSMPLSAKLRTENAPARSPPATPETMELIPTPTRINVRWSPVQGDVDGYRIRLSDPSTGESDTVEVDKFQSSYAFPDLEPNKQYEVSIEALNEEGYSRPIVDRATTGALPGGSELPQAVEAVATGTHIDVSWQPPQLPRTQRPNSYRVSAVPIDDSGIALRPEQSATVHHSQNEYTFTDLMAATKYNVTVAANIDGTLTAPVQRQVTTTMDGPEVPINILAEPESPTALLVSWDFPLESGPPTEIAGRRPNIYYQVRASNPEAGDVYVNSVEMSTTLDGLQPDTLYDVSVAMDFDGRLSDFSEPYPARTFSNVDEAAPQFPMVTQVLLESPENVHATLNWLPPRERTDNIRTYTTQYTLAQDPTLDNTTWDSVTSPASELGTVISNLPTNGVVHYRVQPGYSRDEKGPFTPIQTFSTPVAERPTPDDEPCQSHEDVTRQRINQITERTVPPLGMPLPYCDQFFTDFPCVWSPVCICIPRGTKSLGALPTSIRPSSGPGCTQAQRDDPSVMYRDEPPVSEPAPCQQVFDVTLEAIKESHKNAVPLMASSLPSCREDGYYNDIQCMGTMCLCVDRMGQPTGNMIEIWNVKKLQCT